MCPYELGMSKADCLARRETMPFYRSKSTVYIAWLTVVFTISLDKAYTGRLMSSLLCKAHMFVGAHRCACSTMVAMWLHRNGGHANHCPCIDVCI
jgi:hypothetical protein